MDLVRGLDHAAAECLDDDRVHSVGAYRRLWATSLICSAIIDRANLTDYDPADVLEVRAPEALGIPKGTAGHHVKVLERAGLIRVVATRRVRAATEKFYGRVARLYVLRTDESPKEVGDGALAGVMLSQAADEIFAAKVTPERITAAMTHVRLRPADAHRIALCINRLVAAFQALDHPDGEPHGLAAGFYPSPAALPRRKDGDA